MRFDIVTFMENVAAWLTLIGHSSTNKRFFRISGIQALEEVLQNLGEIKRDHPILIVEDEIEGDYSDALSDNIRDMRNFMFYIVKPGASQDMNSRETIIRECEEIRKQIMAFMFREQKKAAATNADTYGLRNLNRASITYFSVGPIGDACFGMACGFQINDSTAVSFDESLWNIPG